MEQGQLIYNKRGEGRRGQMGTDIGGVGHCSLLLLLLLSVFKDFLGDSSEHVGLESLAYS